MTDSRVMTTGFPYEIYDLEGGLKKIKFFVAKWEVVGSKSRFKGGSMNPALSTFLKYVFYCLTYSLT